MIEASHDPEDVLRLWFPDNGHQNDLAAHEAFWKERMQGGMDARIIRDFADLTKAAAMGLLDHWADAPRTRLGLLIALDQFPRSLWRDSPAAYAQDIKAARLALDGLENGHFDELAPWERTFFVIAIGHCEGPDHLERMDRITPVVEGIISRLSGALIPMGERHRTQHQTVRSIVDRFGRHPHRNEILGRISTPAEQDYIATGDFPHLPKDG